MAACAKRLAVISDHLNSCRLHSVLPEISFTDAKELDTESLVLQNDLLTQEQVDFYNTNGYLVVRNLVPQELLNRYRDRFRQICNDVVKVPGITVMRDVTYAKANRSRGERTVNKLQNFEQDEVLFSYCELPQILKYVACFTGPDIKSVHSMLINKPPDPGTLTSRHPLHQDLHYFPFRPANRMVCSWTAMERVDKKNGCLVVIPGTHYTPLLPHQYPKWEVSQAAQILFLENSPHLYLRVWMTLYFPIPIIWPFAKLFQKRSKWVLESCSMSQINDFLPYTSLHVVRSQKLICLIQSTFMKCKKIPLSGWSK